MSKLLEPFFLWLATAGPLAYAAIFGIVFVETGVVVFPWLPGDSLLFAIAAISARPDKPLDVAILVPVVIVAALIGDNVNYHIGKFQGRRLFDRGNSKFFNKKNLEKTEAFFSKHGPKAIILARFVPIVRTLAPFVAGMGVMPYSRFLTFSVLGAVAWVGACMPLGYIFGNIPTVKKNFELVVVAIVLLSIVPMVIEVLKERKAHKTAG